MKGGTGTIISQRKTSLQRHSNETQIDVRLNLDGNGEARVTTGFGMLDHMLELMAFWGNLDLEIQCNGDIHIDAHHTVEDCGLVLDEALAEVTVDLSGRPWLAWRGDELLPPVIAHEEKDVWREFYKAIASSARCNLHIDFLYGKNGHHLLESAAKGFGLALKKAVAIEDGKIKSTKGVLDK